MKEDYSPSADTLNRITAGIENYAAHHPPLASTEALRDALHLALAVIGSLHPDGTDPYVLDAERKMRAALALAAPAGEPVEASQPAAAADEREAFEKWVSVEEPGLTFERARSNTYRNSLIAWAWDAWQARAALSTAAPAGEPTASLQGEAEPTNESMADALHQIQQWARAYPLKVFPEPDFDKAHAALIAVGMTLDAISASNMRHIITQVQKIADDALAASPQSGTAG